MKLTNNTIYFINDKLENIFSDKDMSSLYLPAKIIFYIEKNKELFNKLAIEIEKTRLTIVNRYKINNENKIPKEHIEQVNKELKELLEIEQEVNFYEIDLDDLNNIQFTPQQMEALMFMINEPEEEEGEEILL